MASRSLGLWLIRHGATEWHGTGRLHGQTDVALGELGRTQAQCLKACLDRYAFDVIYSSDLGRAQETAHVVFKGCDILLDRRLREMAYRSLEGKSKHDFGEAERQALWSCRDNLRPVPIPQGESWRDLEVRVISWLKSLPPTGRVVAFTHGGTIRCAVFSLTADRRARNWRAHLGNISITRLTLHNGRAALEVFGDTAHLSETHG